MPQAARGPEIPEAGYLVEEIADGVFWVADGVFQMMFVVSEEGVIAVDAPPSLGHNILRAIRRVTSQPVNGLVYSHSHGDHVGAASVFPDSIPRYAHRKTAEALARAADPNRPLPTQVFEDTMTVGVGAHRLQLDYKGTNHAEGNIFIYAPGQRVLMLVDVIFPGWVPFGHFSVAASPTGFFDAHTQALSYPFEKLIGGHLTRYGTREDVAVQQEYLDDVRGSTKAAFNADVWETVKASVDTTNPWALFAGYWDAVAAVAADDVAPRWVDRLGGADIWTYRTAWSMAQTLRIDDTFTGPFGITP